MSAIVNFSFEGLGVRIVERNGDPWFVAADVCRALNIQNPTKAVSVLDADERANLKIGPSASDANVISESGLYTLVLRCRDAVKPGTVPHRFRKWVTSEVLPAIRRNRASSMAPRSEAVTPGKVRYAKLQFAWAAARLDALGVDVAAIDMRAVLNFSRAILR